MPRERTNTPTGDGRRRTRNGAPSSSAAVRARRRELRAAHPDLSEEELRALADERVDPEDLVRATDDDTAEQEASDHDRDTPRDKLEGLLLENDEEY